MVDDPNALTYRARVLLDSVSPQGVRLMTLEATFPRFILAEFNTHRMFCLDGETELYFDPPSGTQAITLRAFHDRWTQGEEAELRGLPLRSCNEETGEIYLTHVTASCFSGKKEVYRVVLDDGRSISASRDHLFLTRDGWKRLEDISKGSRVAVEAIGGALGTGGANLAMAVRHRTRKFVPLKSIEYIGLHDTYDIEVAGPFSNFVADGFIVHNSRNSASSRAIPTSKLMDRVFHQPATPFEWGVNKPGMSAETQLDAELANDALGHWLKARDATLQIVEQLAKMNVHKQVVNRLLEPFMWHTVIVSATEWDNFFKLRLAENAQPEIRIIAKLMSDAIATSRSTELELGEWHLPLLQDDERSLDIEAKKKISAARCARVSYLTHGGTREIEKDIELCERLLADRHLSPFEHVATPSPDAEFHANFRGWIQMRKAIETQV